ncbi:MAG: hypothetical protein IJW92_06850 [Clostridia bacterium]|nr:hypothetical protein [Clostridia bacterium]
MKKIVLQKLMLCLLMLSVLSSATMLSAVAESSGSSTVHATVIAASAPSYEITIPSTITTEEINRTSTSSLYRQAFTIEVSDPDYLNGQQVCVRLYSPSSTFELYNEEAGVSLPFSVYGPYLGDTTKMENGDIFAIYTEAGSNTGYIEVDRMDITAEGTYSGSVNFIFSVENMNQ